MVTLTTEFTPRHRSGAQADQSQRPLWDSDATGSPYRGGLHAGSHEPAHRDNIVYWGIALMMLFSLQDAWQSATQAEPVAYSEFEKALADGRIADVTISDRRITGRLKEADGRKTTLVATRVEPDVAARLEKFNVPYGKSRAKVYVSRASFIGRQVLHLGCRDGGRVGGGRYLRRQRLQPSPSGRAFHARREGDALYEGSNQIQRLIISRQVKKAARRAA